MSVKVFPEALFEQPETGNASLLQASQIQGASGKRTCWPVQVDV